MQKARKNNHFLGSVANDLTYQKVDAICAFIDLRAKILSFVEASKIHAIHHVWMMEPKTVKEALCHIKGYSGMAVRSAFAQLISAGYFEPFEGPNGELFWKRSTAGIFCQGYLRSMENDRFFLALRSPLCYLIVGYSELGWIRPQVLAQILNASEPQTKQALGTLVRAGFALNERSGENRGCFKIVSQNWRDRVNLYHVDVVTRLAIQSAQNAMAIEAEKEVRESAKIKNVV